MASIRFLTTHHGYGMATTGTWRRIGIGLRSELSALLLIPENNIEVLWIPLFMGDNNADITIDILISTGDNGEVPCIYHHQKEDIHKRFEAIFQAERIIPPNTEVSIRIQPFNDGKYEIFRIKERE